MEAAAKSRSAMHGQSQMSLNFEGEHEHSLTPGVYIVERATQDMAFANPELAWNCKAVGLNRFLIELPNHTEKPSSKKMEASVVCVTRG